MFNGVQYTALALSVALLFFLYLSQNRSSRPIFESGFLLVLLFYNIFCAISNLIRAEIGHHTSLNVINEQEYFNASLWWLSSILLFYVVYAISKNVSYQTSQLKYPSKNSLQYKQYYQSRRLPYYLGALIVVLVLKFINPYSSIDFGVQSARTANDLQVGGLMIDGLITYLYTSLAIAILPSTLIIGLPALLVGTYFLLLTGSKGMAAGYVVFAYIFFWTQRERSGALGASLKAAVGGLFVVGAALVLVIIASRNRFDSDDISLVSALSSAVGRFTQQDVAAAIYSFDTWRAGFKIEYIIGNISAFLPGFIFENKPLNPAYEINAVYGGSFTAASPSFMGSLLILTDKIIYWPTLFMTAILFAALDRRIYSNRLITSDYSWLVLSLYFSILEANIVISIILILFIIMWHAIISLIDLLSKSKIDDNYVSKRGM